MAEIPVQQKSGIPWWVWLLLGLLVIGLLVWLFTRDDDDRVGASQAEQPVAIAPVADPAMDTNMAVGTAAPAGATGAAGDTGPITDLAAIAGAGDMSALVGRNVQLSNVRVQSVVGDRTFWVEGEGGQRAFVVLNEQPTPDRPGVEGRYDVTQGQVLNVSGIMRSVDEPAFGGQPIEGLPAGQPAVIHAQTLDIQGN